MLSASTGASFAASRAGNHAAIKTAPKQSASAAPMERGEMNSVWMLVRM